MITLGNPHDTNGTVDIGSHDTFADLNCNPSEKTRQNLFLGAGR